MNVTIKPGRKTSEFWLHLLAQLPTVLGLILGASNPVTLAVGGATAIATTLYAKNRTQLKAKALEAAVECAKAAVAVAGNK